MNPRGRTLALFGPALPVIEQRAEECGVCPSEYVEWIVNAWLALGAPTCNETERRQRNHRGHKKIAAQLNTEGAVTSFVRITKRRPRAKKEAA